MPAAEGGVVVPPVPVVVVGGPLPPLLQLEIVRRIGKTKERGAEEFEGMHFSLLVFVRTGSKRKGYQLDARDRSGE